MKKIRIDPFSTTARPERRIEITPEIVEVLEAQDQVFRERFGREPGPEDPMFLDPDADQPRVPTEAQKQEIIDAMHQVILNAGIDPAFAYAFRKTGFLLAEENVKYMTPAELAEWNDAIEEYRSNKCRMH
jgi:integrase